MGVASGLAALLLVFDGAGDGKASSGSWTCTGLCNVWANRGSVANNGPGDGGIEECPNEAGEPAL